VPAAKQNAIKKADEEPGDWVAEQIDLMCANLLARPSLRRGPFIFDDGQLKAMVSKSSSAGKAKRAIAGKRE
jgi:hypothetical protein